WIAIWVLTALVALAIGIAGAALKSRRFAMPLFSGPGRKFIARFIPPILAGGGVPPGFFSSGGSRLLPRAVVPFCGGVVVGGGRASVRIVPIMGACFMLIGTMTLLVPGYSEELMSAGFGGLHVLFGTVIAVKYGG